MIDDAQLIAEMILRGLPDEKERRRYALLQAAATIYAGSYVDVGAGTEEAYTGFGIYPTQAVDDAEKLLAEIERRETKAEAKP